MKKSILYFPWILNVILAIGILFLVDGLKDKQAAYENAMELVNKTERTPAQSTTRHPKDDLWAFGQAVLLGSSKKNVELLEKQYLPGLKINAALEKTKIDRTRGEDWDYYIQEKVDDEIKIEIWVRASFYSDELVDISLGRRKIN